jgi:staphylococcal nuclease domain-containing protein 1
MHTMPVDSAAFMAEWRGTPLDAVVEQVKDGSTLRVRLLLPEGDHQVVNLALAGVRAARAAGKPGETSEPLGEEGKYFTETRLLHRAVKATLLSLPGSTAASPFQANGAPPTASIFIGTVLHPAGNVAEFLVAAGLARVVDWHAGMLSAQPGAMERLRAAERAAKEQRLGLYAAGAGAPSTAGTSGARPGPASARAFEGTVIRAWTGDQVSIADTQGVERRVQLSSVRGPKMSDPKQAHWAHEAREFLRKRLIGKHVRVHVDYVKPKDGEFGERECATVRYGGANACVR